MFWILKRNTISIHNVLSKTLKLVGSVNMSSIPVRKESVAVANAVVNLFSNNKTQIHPYKQNLEKVTADALELHNIDLVSVGSSICSPTVFETLKFRIRS